MLRSHRLAAVVVAALCLPLFSACTGRRFRRCWRCWPWHHTAAGRRGVDGPAPRRRCPKGRRAAGRWPSATSSTARRWTRHGGPTIPARSPTRVAATSTINSWSGTRPRTARSVPAQLVMTAKREQVTSPSGNRYDWTSCLITTARSYNFQYGYIEERSILPAQRGFWPAFWTWQARGVDQHTETDVYEYYSDNRQRLYATQYSGAPGPLRLAPVVRPDAGLAHLRGGDRSVRNDLVRRRCPGLPHRRHLGRADQHHHESRRVLADSAGRRHDRRDQARGLCPRLEARVVSRRIARPSRAPAVFAIRSLTSTVR